MLDKIIDFFASRHLLSNLLYIAVIIGGCLAWINTNKEELPEVTFDSARITIRYPGATAEEVEFFITREVEKKLKGLDGIYRITSNSSEAVSSINVEIEPDYGDIEEVITEIRNTVLDVDLPTDVIEDPNVRVFKTTKKAILDVSLIHKDHPILSPESRRLLQQYALALETRLVNEPEINSVNKSGYLEPEIKIELDPEQLNRLELPFNTVMRTIRNNNIRQPAGNLEIDKEPKVTLSAELNNVEDLKNLIVQGGFEGNLFRLGDIATIEDTYAKNKEIIKVNGHEAIMFNVVKNSSYGILEALDAVYRALDGFKENNIADSQIDIILLDDESIDLRNRIDLISVNGLIGFALILITLFIFLDWKSGLWVAMGIPFTLCFTMIVSFLMGQTINGMTLAAVIIVMGIVVDDAIVVAENITRMSRSGYSLQDAVVKGTSFVMLPVIASIVTTCVAFIPLYFFDNHIGKMIACMPAIIFLMLGSSLLESFFILPGHMNLGSLRKKARESKEAIGHWFDRIESIYEKFLKQALRVWWLVTILFIGFLLAVAHITKENIKYVMFPNEETRDLVLTGKTENGMRRYETAQKVTEIENIVSAYYGKEVVGMRTEIARSRRGGAVEENAFRMIIEIVPKEERIKSADQIIKEIESEMKKLSGFQKLRFSKSRWGQGSGSPIEVVVQQNNDEIRTKVVNEIMDAMRSRKDLKNIENDFSLRVPEYKIHLNREMITRLSIDPNDIASTFRAALEGSILYEYTNGDEDIQVRLTTTEAAKSDIEKLLDLPVENRNNYLVPLRNVVSVEKVDSPITIQRRELKRTNLVFSDIEEGSQLTPLDIAEDFEKNVFPEILSRYPTTSLSFGGEIYDTRESSNNLINAVILVVLLIFIVLAILFNSLWRPIVIMLTIPFGVACILLAFYLHGKLLFGFYAAVGALGLAGVVINDSIIMLVKLDHDYPSRKKENRSSTVIASIAKTRLRAVFLTTLTSVAGLLPTAYGFAGYDAKLAEMMLALTWGMVGGTFITLLLVPCIFQGEKKFLSLFHKEQNTSYAA